MDMTDVSDYYTMYVSIQGVSEDVFWFRDIGFVKQVAANKHSFDKWLRWQSEKRARENAKKRS